MFYGVTHTVSAKNTPPFFANFFQIATVCTSLEFLSEVFERNIEKM